MKRVGLHVVRMTFLSTSLLTALAACDRAPPAQTAAEAPAPPAPPADAAELIAALAGAPTDIALPHDRPRGARQSIEADSVRRRLGPIPPEWQTVTDEALRRMRDAAQPVQHRPPPEQRDRH